MLKLDNAVGLDLANAELLSEEEKGEIPEDIVDLAEKRWQAKKNKDWTKADSLRAELKEKGYEIKDSSDSYTINKI